MKTAILMGLVAFLAAPIHNAYALPAHQHASNSELTAAVLGGHITSLEAHRLHLLAVRSPTSLPTEWRHLVGNVPTCLTAPIRELSQGLDAFRADQQHELAALLAFPDVEGPYLQSDVYPLRVHFPGDADRSTAVAALNAVERSWRIEVDEMGFLAPLPDNGFAGSDDLDVFILPGTGGAGAVALEPNYRTPWNDWSTYITIDPEDYGGDLLGVTLAHEFNHSCQAAYDWWETIVALESTATFIEDRVYDDANDLYNYVSYFQALPHKPVDYLGGTWAWYVYAAALFPMFIAERYGDDVVVEMWWGSRQRGYRNEPDFIDGLDAALNGSAGINFAEAARTFAHWRYFIGSNDDGFHFTEGQAMGDANQVFLEGAFTTQTLPRGPVVVANPPAETAANLFEITVNPSHADATLSWQFEGAAGADWALDLLAIPPTGPAETIRSSASGQSSGDLRLTGYETIVVVVVNLGDGQHDPEKREWSGLSYDLTLELTSAVSTAAVATQ